ncbi:TetR/AcrR family transcriptional regulator [Actinomadura sp. NEAU-AAG7]|uniref:TetR/AcrR family transcriptional regulator n=1 Tax=Actinomadura sp. NEAU-AAG7 TaxID=2839640 RepID=UPI001BE49F72|nr:TetR/AcrR family transcriptional regulator [Actinomadura sp. NEAU-AAG7]MBT2208605.1 TetR/AcrR family transcriptional regulator [Actinomadura sp. NEAU-AAG7]
MARPRRFEEGRAVDAAMRAFWTAGYEGTSTRDLCEATGLGRSSVYNTFSSKHDLFVRALAHYMDERTGRLLDLLEGDGSPKEKLRTLLLQTADLETGDPVGCLVVNTMVEMVQRDPEIAAMVERDQRRRVEALRAAIEAGMRAGEIDAARDPAALTHYIVAIVSGMRVAASGGADHETLVSIAETAMTAL